MRYVALLRGINVGGKSIIKMADLRRVVEGCGFTSVQTYIQSGNIVFDSTTQRRAATTKIKECLHRGLGYDSRTIVLTKAQLESVIAGVPRGWKGDNILRRYLAFVGEPFTPEDVERVVEPRVGVDFVSTGPGVVYLSTLLSGITKSGFTKLVSTSVYKEITIRNFDTVKKLAELARSP